MNSVWIFHANEACFAGAVFTDRAAAEAWILAQRLSGTLTKYPLDVSVYDWAIADRFLHTQAR